MASNTLHCEVCGADYSEAMSCHPCNRRLSRGQAAFLRTLITEKLQALSSVSADFNKNTWTFYAPGNFECASGSYLFMHIDDWKAVWDAIDGTTDTSTAVQP